MFNPYRRFIAHSQTRAIRQIRIQLIPVAMFMALLMGSLGLPLVSQADVLRQSEEQGQDSLELPSGEIPLDIPDAALPDNETEVALQPGEEIPLPSLESAWEGETVVDVMQLGTRLADFLRVETNGDFEFTFIPGPGGGSVRILPVADVLTLDGGPLYLEMAWRLGDDLLLPLPAGQRLDVELTARTYSPPDGVTLSIRERVDGTWFSSSVEMSEIAWTTYTPARTLAEEADRAEIALRWLPALENAWVEIQLPRLVVDRPEFGAPPLSATDTPAPTPEPTPIGEPTATPEPPTPEDSEVADAEPEELMVLDTPTPMLIVVTSTPTPQDVFEEATRVAMATSWAPVVGTATPTPENMVTPTHTPTPFVIVVTNTPVPENAATAVYVERLATAIAFTTGTPTPVPPEATVVLATTTPVPQPTQPRPTNTPTPLFVYLDQLPPTATPQPTAEFPQVLMGKIMFLTDFRATQNQPNVLLMNPDGSGVAIMSTRLFYNRAVERDAYSPDRRFFTYAQREGTHADGTRLQVKFDDSHYDALRNPVSFFDAGHAWSPVWAPNRQAVAFVSNSTGNDEIFLANLNEWPALQLTHNEWEWDHHPSFSPDGSQIVFSSNRITGVRQIWMMDASGGNQRQITNFPFQAWNPVWVKYPDS